MKCVICKQGHTHKGRTTVTLTRGQTTVVIKDVSAEIDENCAEYCLTEEAARKVQALADSSYSSDHA